MRRTAISLRNRSADGGVRSNTSLDVDPSATVLRSHIAFDTALRTYGKVTQDGVVFRLAEDDEMGAYLLTIRDHEPTDRVERFRGKCADFNMDSWMSITDCFLVLLVMENGDSIPAGQLTNLAEWGIWNDGSTPDLTLDPTDKLAFVGRNGLEQGCGFELRAANGEIMNGTTLLNGIML